MLVTLNTCGLYCERGDFYIDPWRAVDRAVITHAHSDHARWGSKEYLAAGPGLSILRLRLGGSANIRTINYGEPLVIQGVRISLHPAGHILGSAQVRLEYAGEVWVITGDYKLQPDASCAPFEALKCHTLVTESTFGLPIYRWPDPARVFKEINQWWRKNQTDGNTSILMGYALGKAQRLLAGIDASIGPIYTHGAVQKMNEAYRAAGCNLPQTSTATSNQKSKIQNQKSQWSQSLIIAPTSAMGSPWMRKFGTASTAFASGWMAVRGARRWRAVDRGFVLSDHVDWQGLLSVIKQSGAERVWVTHGYVAPVVRYLREQGYDAHGVRTEYEGELDIASANETAEHDAGSQKLPCAPNPDGVA